MVEIKKKVFKKVFKKKVFLKSSTIHAEIKLRSLSKTSIVSSRYILY